MVDDHLLTAYFTYKKLEWENFHIKNKQSTVNFNSSSNDALSGLGNKKQYSENCRKAIYDKYKIEFPFWCCIGCC